MLLYGANLSWTDKAERGDTEVQVLFKKDPHFLWDQLPFWIMEVVDMVILLLE